MWYVYALVDRRMPRRKIRGHTIEAVAAGGMFAMAERMRTAPALTADNLVRQHAIVLALARAASAILPARFGSLLDHDELDRVVGVRGAQLREAFALVRGCEQMTVRVIGEAERPEAVPHGAASSGSSAGTAYLQQRRAEAGYPLPEAVRRLGDGVRTLVRAERAEPGPPGVRAIVYHLIEKKRRRLYSRAIDDAAAAVAPFTLQVTGPFPPFAFAPELLG